jgi:hypothetical protein
MDERTGRGGARGGREGRAWWMTNEAGIFWRLKDGSGTDERGVVLDYAGGLALGAVAAYDVQTRSAYK